MKLTRHSIGIAAGYACSIAVLLFSLSCGGGSKATAPVPPPDPQCSVAPTSLDFGTTQIGTSSAAKTLTITNSGGGTLAGSVASSAPFAIVGATSYSLTGGQSVTFSVRFSPTAIGAQSAQLSTGTGCSVVACTGVGSATVGCLVRPDTLDFGTVPSGQMAERTFSLVNTGTAPFSASVSTGSCAGFSIVGNPHVSPPVGDSVQVTIRYAPTTVGPQTCSVKVGDCGTVFCRATGTGSPSISVSPTTLDFGSVMVGSTRCESFTITNISTNNVISGAINYVGCTYDSGQQRFIFTVSPNSYYLNPGQQTTIQVCFAPTAIRPEGCTLTISERSSFGPSVRLTGEGIDRPPSCQVGLGPTREPDFDFGVLAVGQRSRLWRLFLENAGGGTLSGSMSAPCPGYELSGPGTSYSLQAREETHADITVTPPQSGPQTCTIQLGQGCGTIRGKVFAVDTDVRCLVFPDSLAFGNVRGFCNNPGTDWVAGHFTLINPRTATLTGSVFSPNASVYQVSPPTYTIGPGSSQTFTVRLYYNTPGAPRRVTINLDDSGSSDCHLIVASFTPLTDVSRCVRVSSEVLAFGMVPIGQSVERMVTLNNGASVAVSGTATFSAPGYSIVGDPGYTLGAGESKTFTIRFTPSSAFPYWATMFTGVGQSVLLEGWGVVP